MEILWFFLGMLAAVLLLIGGVILDRSEQRQAAESAKKPPSKKGTKKELTYADVLNAVQLANLYSYDGTPQESAEDVARRILYGGDAH